MMATGINERIEQAKRGRTGLMRDRTAAAFPQPGIIDSMLYAETEMGEMLDAILRERRPADVRNNERNHDPINELGQAIVMLNTAWNQVYDAWHVGGGVALDEETESLVEVLQGYHEWMADVYASFVSGDLPHGHQFAYLSVSLDQMAAWLGTTATEAERIACERFEAKHAIKEAAA